MPWADANKVGELAYGADTHGADYEGLYDLNGNQAAYIAYKTVPDSPFPFITKYQDADDYVDTIGDVLYRSQRFWTFYDNAEFDQTGKWIGYNGNIDGFFYGPVSCSYDTDGQLTEIDTAPADDGGDDSQDAYSAHLQLAYQYNGKLSTARYSDNAYIFHQNPSGGRDIFYDSEGRMVYESASYVASGDQYCYYFYQGGGKQPWACVWYGGQWWSDEEQAGIDCAYGIYLNVTIFQPK